jgi:hypothetical protein
MDVWVESAPTLPPGLTASKSVMNTRLSIAPFRVENDLFAHQRARLSFRACDVTAALRSVAADRKVSTDWSGVNLFRRGSELPSHAFTATRKFNRWTRQKNESRLVYSRPTGRSRYFSNAVQSRW